MQYRLTSNTSEESLFISQIVNQYLYNQKLQA